VTQQEDVKVLAEYNVKPLPDQWYISKHGITEAWRTGYTGKGVVVTVVDHGLHWRHPDLRPNFDSRASYDFVDDDTDPSESLVSSDLYSID